MNVKKISFSFSKVKKTEKVTPQQEKKEYIDCLEGKSIKIIGGGNVEKMDLVIPMKANKKPSFEMIAKLKGEETYSKSEDLKGAVTQDSKSVISINKPETLEQRAAREILEDLKNPTDKASNVLHVSLSNEMSLIGEKESTLEDYENIPITDFGMAMLRGMGWVPAAAINKNEKHSQPALRPKGLGLGADKVVKQPDDTSNGGSKEEIKIKKGSYLKITTGPHVGRYGQISGFDENSGRLIVELSLKGGSINISEFMVQLLSKNEYEKHTRIINSTKYDEYKIQEYLAESGKSERRREGIDETESNERKSRKTSPCDTSARPSKKQNESNKGNGISYGDKAGNKTENRYSLANEDEIKSGNLRKYNSSSNFGESDSSLDLMRTKKKSRSSRRSRSRSQKVKIDRDKKRKGKKKKRDRSRSPNYRKYKK